MTDSDASLEKRLAGQFVTAFGADEEQAEAATRRVAAFQADHEAVTVDAVVEAIRETGAYDEFRHRYNDAVGEIAAGVEGCTDSRAYRLAGFGELAADPEQGA